MPKTTKKLLLLTCFAVAPIACDSSFGSFAKNIGEANPFGGAVGAARSTGSFSKGSGHLASGYAQAKNARPSSPRKAVGQVPTKNATGPVAVNGINNTLRRSVLYSAFSKKCHQIQIGQVQGILRGITTGAFKTKPDRERAYTALSALLVNIIDRFIKDVLGKSYNDTALIKKIGENPDLNSFILKQLRSFLYYDKTKGVFRGAALKIPLNNIFHQLFLERLEPGTDAEVIRFVRASICFAMGGNLSQADKEKLIKDAKANEAARSNIKKENDNKTRKVFDSSEKNLLKILEYTRTLNLDPSPKIPLLENNFILLIDPENPIIGPYRGASVRLEDPYFKNSQDDFSRMEKNGRGANGYDEDRGRWGGQRIGRNQDRGDDLRMDHNGGKSGDFDDDRRGDDRTGFDGKGQGTCQGLDDRDDSRRGNNRRGFDDEDTRRGDDRNDRDDSRRWKNGRGFDDEDTRRGDDRNDRDDSRKGNSGGGFDDDDTRRGDDRNDRDDSRRGNNGGGVDDDDTRRGDERNDRDDSRRGNNGGGFDDEDTRRGDERNDRDDSRRGNNGGGFDDEDTRRGDERNDRDDSRRGNNGGGFDDDDTQRGDERNERDDSRRGNSGGGFDDDDKRRGDERIGFGRSGSEKGLLDYAKKLGLRPVIVQEVPPRGGKIFYLVEIRPSKVSRPKFSDNKGLKENERGQDERGRRDEDTRGERGKGTDSRW